MINCRVWVNEKFCGEHFGGYLPFMMDITENLREENTLPVEADNRDDPDTPPGKPTPDLDFLYYGGIYRNVKIMIFPDLYLTDAMDPTVLRGGLQTEVSLLKDTQAAKR